ncbi:DUF1275 domain-containing protein [Sulfitobacter sp. S0837]|uniref:YoaK family protein n=1 Tax=Sulfitobacter maritimus TaxID=2741719 RepID=UPI00158228BE|nr:YoaK family protein [Sulfitobacter maritimus]NUH64056.1 DUF1275 domain-containing protein [Sulfitobacter maritimus]
MSSVSNRTRPIEVLMYALTFTSGIIDAVTILGLGDIFASLMTGNVVYIGMGLGGYDEVSPLRSVFAIAAFVLGSILAGRLATQFINRAVGSWLLVVCTIEVLFILGAAGAALQIGPDGPPDPLSMQVLIAIGMASVAMGLRNSTILRLSIPDLKVTVLTLSISGFGADIGSGKSDQQKQLRRLFSIALIGAGATCGAMLFYRYGVAVPLCLIATIVATATFAFSRTAEARLIVSEL